MSYLNFISCATCHGFGTKTLHRNLVNGHIPQLTKLADHPPYFSIANLNDFKNDREKAHHLINQQIQTLTHEFSSQKNDRWGIIFASTKGLTEDFVWDKANTNFDPYSPALDFIKEIFPFDCQQALTISNACTSSHGAIELGQRWLKRNQVDHVFILAMDLVGPFVLKGFASLRALSESQTIRPFDKNRDGLLLGDAIASCVLSQKTTAHSLYISPVITLCEGVSATRPDTSGKNLARCFTDTTKNSPDILLAHGTGTFYNDLTESRAMRLAFKSKRPPRVTCSKWAIGHSLGVSGLIDLCLASEIIKTQTAPGIKTLESSDLEVSEWLLKDNFQGEINSLLISSLGFGGMCSAFQVSMEKN